MTHLTASDFAELRRAAATDPRLRHLAECAECAARAEAEMRPEAAVRALSAAFSEADDEAHPEEELPLYVDGKLPGARLAAIDEHLGRCASCREEVEDLRAFSRTLQPARRPRRSRWVFLAAAAALVVLLFLRRDDVPVTPDPPGHPTTTVTTATVATTSTVEPPPHVPPRPARRPEWEALVAAAVRSGQLQIAADVLHFGSPDDYRGTTTGSKKSALAPSATAVDETRPAFTWPATPGATYEVIVAGADGAEAARSGPLDVARWQPETPLKRGETYRWQVIVGDSLVLPERPAPPAIFRVIGAKEHAELEAARSAHPDDHLLLGILYARAGELRAAREHLERAGAEGLVKDLDRKLRRGRG